jgi:Lipocalin-like domain
MIAYAGTYTIDGDRWITISDLSHNEIYIGTPQVRFFKVEGDKLSIRVPEQPSAAFPGKMVTGTLEWVRER